jgi:aryl-alcohol dehydrogenase-like predicted oxidoreductase
MLQDMEHTTLGTSDIRVSRVGLGCNNFGRRLDLDGTRAVVDAALDAGIDFCDTADVYGGDGASERLLGQVLQGRWDQVVLATKFGIEMGDGRGGGAPAYAKAAVRASLERLGADRIDLFYYHRPDGVTPLTETLGALDELVDEGLIRTYGASNLSAEQLEEAHAFAASRPAGRFVALQNEYSLLERDAEADTLPLCARYDIGFVPFFPLASGLLSGKYTRGEAPPAGTRLAARPDALTDAAFDRIEAFAAFAEERGHTLLELAIAGLASQRGVASVIAGATRPEQARANAAAGDWQLSEEDLAALAALSG